MKSEDVGLIVHRFDENVVVAELFVRCPGCSDVTVHWGPSVHVGDIDLKVIFAQLHEHGAV